MRHFHFFTFLFLLLLIFTQAQVQVLAQPGKARVLTPNETDTFLKTMSDSLKSIETLQASFVQKRILTVFMDTLVSSGQFYFEVPDRLRWEVRKSFHTILITDNGRVAKFDFQDGRMRKLRIGAEDIMKEIMKQIIYWMQGDFSASASIYTISVEAVAGKETEMEHIIKLQPRSQAMRESLSLIELTVSPYNYHITQVALHEAGLGLTRIFFSDEIVNRRFDQGLFDLSTPLLE
jgi:outer membrane lipoprotein-sorting protein